jgi:hypothetical protein
MSGAATNRPQGRISSCGYRKPDRIPAVRKRWREMNTTITIENDEDDAAFRRGYDCGRVLKVSKQAIVKRVVKQRDLLKNATTPFPPEES